MGSTHINVGPFTQIIRHHQLNADARVHRKREHLRGMRGSDERANFDSLNEEWARGDAQHEADGTARCRRIPACVVRGFARGYSCSLAMTCEELKTQT